MYYCTVLYLPQSSLSHSSSSNCWFVVFDWINSKVLTANGKWSWLKIGQVHPTIDQPWTPSFLNMFIFWHCVKWICTWGLSTFRGVSTPRYNTPSHLQKKEQQVTMNLHLNDIEQKTKIYKDDAVTEMMLHLLPIREIKWQTNTLNCSSTATELQTIQIWSSKQYYKLSILHNFTIVHL